MSRWEERTRVGQTRKRERVEETQVRMGGITKGVSKCVGESGDGWASKRGGERSEGRRRNEGESGMRWMEKDRVRHLSSCLVYIHRKYELKTWYRSFRWIYNRDLWTTAIRTHCETHSTPVPVMHLGVVWRSTPHRIHHHLWLYQILAGSWCGAMPVTL